ncbi:hypothetical protein BE17_10595 [Sorangium cellulosum]|uniref:Uncharacterized protein n=1 Tax=Sorangium cellulosum TaxID=56 RepID=A0A150QRC9_SORCE|nr:hypothetical protein BE17_10595 [Sorangium cellulosum]
MSSPGYARRTASMIGRKLAARGVVTQLRSSTPTLSISAPPSRATAAHVSKNRRYDSAQRAQPASSPGSICARHSPLSTQRCGTSSTLSPRACACAIAASTLRRFSWKGASKTRSTPVPLPSHTRPNGVRLIQVAPMAAASSIARPLAAVP